MVVFYFYLATIRNDLNVLEKEDLIINFHVGATLTEQSNNLEFHKRDKLNSTEKDTISSESLKLIKSDKCILLDAQKVY